MQSSAFTCPQGTESTNRAWSKAGHARYCEPLRNGKWEAWSEGHRQVEGEYKNGKESGTWRWYGADGRPYLEAIFENGTKVSERKISQ